MPPNEHGPAVTVGLAGGRELPGELAEPFSPYQTTLSLQSAGGDRARIDVRDVVWVGVHRDPERARLAAPPSDGERVHVETGEGKSLDVIAPPRARWGALGFFGVPTDPASPFAQVFFYRAGLDAGARARAATTLAARSASELPTRRRAGEILRAHRSWPPGRPEALAAERHRHLRIGELLVEEGRLSNADLEAALRQQRRTPGARLGELLVRLGSIGERDLARALAEKFHLPFVDLDECLIDERAAREVPSSLLVRYHVLPLESDASSLIAALAEPPGTDALDALRLQTGKRVLPVVVPRSQLERWLASHGGAAAPSGEPAGEDFTGILAELVETGRGEQLARHVELAESDAGMVRLVNSLLLDAFRRGASDIHVEAPDAQAHQAEGRVRLRVDGECVPYHDVPATVMTPLATRLKILAELDIAERRKPQDGKIRVRLDRCDVELRVATIPTVGGGEDVVLRLLPPAAARPLEGMALSERNLQELRRLLALPYGLLLCVGPTGSGKTTTLHSALAVLNTPSTKVWTVEDPVEITQVGLRQVQVRRKAGLDFATALRAFLRADPDVIMVGEMRDLETASVAVEASLTGHLVLSTLHTNTAPETVTRLLDMGLEPFGFADSLLGVLAQRLVRAICDACLEPYAVNEDERRVLSGAGYSSDVANGELLLFHGRGCAACGGTGYRGRVAVHELLVVDDAMRTAIARRASAEELRAMAIAGGMRTLLQDGVAKAVAGLTDLRAVLAACSR